MESARDGGSSKDCVTVQCQLESRIGCDRRGGPDHFCLVFPSSRFSSFGRQSSFAYEPTVTDLGGVDDRDSPTFTGRSRSPSSSLASSSATYWAGEDDEEDMREPSQKGPLQQQQHLQQQQQPPLTHLSVGQLQEMAQRQQHQIEAQQQMLVAKEQRLKYLRQQDLRQQQMAAEYERLRRLREKVEAQELKLRKLRALRGQNGHNGGAANLNANAAVLADLESIRGLFNEKEKELAMAVRRVEELTHQLEDLRSGRMNGGGGGGQPQQYPTPQMVELERLRRELAYRKQLNEQQNSMISQQRAQLAMGQDEMVKIDNRILELQDRLARKRMMNQHLASQISAATSAKQAQLRAIQQGMAGKKNKPVSTVEPFQRQPQPMQHPGEFQQDELHNKINQKGADDASKYQTLPFGTKFNQGQKIEQLKQEKENNNVQFANDLPQPPPPAQQAGGGAAPRPVPGAGYIDHQGNFNPAQPRPVSSVAPVFPTQSDVNQKQSQLQRPTQLFPDNFKPGYALPPDGHHRDSPESPTKPKPALPPKPLVGKPGQQPPPYVPAPMPDNSRHLQQQQQQLDDSSITVAGNQSYHPSGNLSVSSAHPEEGTSVDDDSPSDGEGKGAYNANNHNVHISINRRIEMPPAFHFPEDQTPPSDLLGNEGSRDAPDNAAMYNPMMSQIYQEFDQLTTEEKNQLFKGVLEEEDYSDQPVPEFETDNDEDGAERPPGIMRTTNLKGLESSTSHNKHVCFDPLALLLDASLEGELELVRATARQVADASAANDEGITALHNAICAGHFDIVCFLVKFGCDVNAQDSDGWTPLHCAASCNNLPMVRFLVEHGACVFATTFSDHETAAQKCEEDEEGFAGCSEYLYGVQEKLGGAGSGNRVFAVFDYSAGRDDELSLEAGDALEVVRRGDDVEQEWWWARHGGDGREGYVPKNFLGLHPRVQPRRGEDESSSMSEGSAEEGDSDSKASNGGEQQQGKARSDAGDQASS